MVSAMADPQLPPPEILDEIDAHMYKTAIFRAAIELQVWAKVAAGFNTADRMAAQEHWDPIGTRLLLDDLCGLRLLSREGTEYRLVPESEWYLLPDKPTYMGAYLQADFGWEGNGQLANAIRAGQRPIGYSATSPETASTWIGIYAGSLGAPDAYLSRCDQMWKEAGVEPRQGLWVLDVACGPAPRSLALARAHPGVRVTLIDWEGVLDNAIELASKLGVAAQLDCFAGDMWGTPFGSQRFDIVHLGSITHFLSPEENTRLFTKAYESLVEGGALVINAVRREYPSAMAPGLWFYATSKGGAPYDFAEYSEMLREAGFEEIIDVAAQPIKAIKRLRSPASIGGGETTR